MNNEHANETIIPLHEWALVQPEHPAEEKSAGGLILARDSKKHPRLRAKVLAVGPGEVKDGVRIQTAARPGDVVLLQKHNLAQGLIYHDDEHGPCLIPQSEIIAIVRRRRGASIDDGRWPGDTPLTPDVYAASDDKMKPAEVALYSSNDEQARSDTERLLRRVDRLEERQNLLAIEVTDVRKAGT